MDAKPKWSQRKLGAHADARAATIQKLLSPALERVAQRELDEPRRPGGAGNFAEGAIGQGESFRRRSPMGCQNWRGSRCYEFMSASHNTPPLRYETAQLRSRERTYPNFKTSFSWIRMMDRRTRRVRILASYRS